jgi:phytol kinase
MLQNDFLALVATFALALSWLRLNDFAAARGWISSTLSRKVIHIGTGPIFVLCWLLFGDNLRSRFLAALIPLAITMQFLLIGLEWLKDPAAVAAMTRHGKAREILRGPLYYGIVFVLLTLLYWYHSPIGLTALMLLCGGDGLADVVGRRLKSLSLPWSPEKTLAGSLAMFVGGWLLTVGVLAVFVTMGKLPSPMSQYLVPVSIITLLAMLVESLPLRDWDNLTVPLVATLLGHIFFA